MSMSPLLNHFSSPALELIVAVQEENNIFIQFFYFNIWYADVEIACHVGVLRVSQIWVSEREQECGAA